MNEATKNLVIGLAQKKIGDEKGKNHVQNGWSSHRSIMPLARALVFPPLLIETNTMLVHFIEK